MGRVQVLPPVLTDGDEQAPSALVLGGVLIGGGAWLVLARHDRWAGASALGATAALVFGSVRATASHDRVLRFLDSVTDRAFDGAILPAIAVAMRHTDMTVSALAVVAAGLSFVAAYIRTKGKALGYVVRDSLALRAARYVGVGVGLLAHGLLGGLIAAIAISAFTAIDNSRQVTGQPA